MIREVFLATFIAKQYELNYRSAWLLLHKVREAMGNRDGEYQLSDIVELDEAFFGGPTENGKRGRGTDKSIVLVGVSLTPQGYPTFVKMEVIPNVKGKTLVDFANEHITPGSTINSDAYASYKALAKEGFDHHSIPFNPKENPDHLNWLHTMISNAKTNVCGTFHGLDGKHLQRYLNEFCYKTNRGKVENRLFNRLLFACSNTATITYCKLVG